MAWKNTESN